GKGNKINSSGNVSLNGTIAFDLTGIEANSTDTALTLNGTNVTGTTKINIADTITSGKYLLIESATALNPEHFTVIPRILLPADLFYDNNNKTLGIERTIQTAEQFTTQNNFRNNQTQIAALLDGYAPAQQVLLSLENREQLEEIIKPLLVAEIAAETQNLPMNHPYLRVFNHVSNLPTRNVNSNFNNVNSGTLFRGQSACSPVYCNMITSKPEFWFEGYYRAENVSSDSNALGYKTSRGGMMVGVDRSFSNQLLTGLVFGYGNPRTYNSNAKTKADDYTFGAYSRLKIAGIFVNSFLAYGHQNYELHQHFTNSNTRYNGNSFYASFELLKPLNLRNGISVSPLAAIDFQKSWADGFNVNVARLPLAVGKSDLEQTVLRVGINSSYKNLRTRLQYGYQVAGDLYGTSRTSIVGGNNSRVLTGVNLGRNTLNVGLGCDFKIGKRTKLFADYDFDLGERANSHSGQFGLAINF
ncbi:MAG: autotransporter outer membrane beta-barrel domain-containing protein, partial [Planctomycetaceae bacterium]|nr:autotransporter outer membrane beta-barrel domain-containing protein [Planctomycetaceae bacterium]